MQFQFYQSLSNPNTTQVYWFPALSYNAYDKLILRMDLYNYGLVTRKWEWYLGPSYSTGQNQLTGAGSLEYNYLPQTSSPFHRISAGLYARYLHYDENLAYFRLSPSISFRFRKPYPRSTKLQRLRLRSVHLERQLDPRFKGLANDISNASYWVVDLTHRYRRNQSTTALYH
ncbi:MAG: hypothetical protein U5L96_06350 [Owenweeksia sp.]|nr:hypothetical protein [Owenweeksia sp.]